MCSIPKFSVCVVMFMPSGGGEGRLKLLGNNRKAGREEAKLEKKGHSTGYLAEPPDNEGTRRTPTTRHVTVLHLLSLPDSCEPSRYALTTALKAMPRHANSEHRWTPTWSEEGVKAQPHGLCVICLERDDRHWVLLTQTKRA